MSYSNQGQGCQFHPTSVPPQDTPIPPDQSISADFSTQEYHSAMYAPVRYYKRIL
ncbi:unnamed protein product [Rhodiola kirilowii]